MWIDYYICFPSWKDRDVTIAGDFKLECIYVLHDIHEIINNAYDITEECIRILLYKIWKECLNTQLIFDV